MSRHDGTTDGSGGARGRDGPRLVLVLYALLVAVGGVSGALVAVFVEGATAPRLFGLVTLPPSVVGFAVYGAVTVGVALGLPLMLVAYVSRRIDDPDAVDD